MEFLMIEWLEMDLNELFASNILSKLPFNQKIIRFETSRDELQENDDKFG